MKLNSLHAGIIFPVMLFVISCVPAKKLSYFNDLDNLKEPAHNPRIQKAIMPFDKLYIRVVSIDQQTNQIFNSTEELRSGGMGSSNVVGYLVNENGNINFPFVGDINVASLTTAQAGAKIQKELNAYVPNTAIVVKYVDNQVTIMGEVQRQGVYTFVQDKINIYEALGLGGGITRYGNRKKVVLIRSEGDKIMHHRLNLADSQIANKDFYYVYPNDVIVVEPLNAISSSYANITYTTILSSVTTLIAVLLFTGVTF